MQDTLQPRLGSCSRAPNTARWELVQSGLLPCFLSFRVAAMGCLMFIILDPSFSHALSLFVYFTQESEPSPVPYPG